jgi:hypothetical protein
MEIPTDDEAEALSVWTNEVKALECRSKDESFEQADREQATKDLQALRRKRPSATRTLVIRELPEPRETVVFIQGDFTRPGKPVQRGFPQALGGTKTGNSTAASVETNHPRTDAETSAQETLTRLDLANWLVSRDNPLTARVMMNRVWQQLFGRGLVETENDFGTMGTPPSHPELLDWLAVEFMDSGWHWKPLIRLVVTSNTYRQSSHIRSDLTEKDPRNLWLARQSRLRLDAELVRDVALKASGLLVDTLGGPPVYPPQPEGLSAFTQSRHAWPVSESGDRHRRGLYTYLQRSTLYPALAVFDAPDTFTSCTRRLRSNTPLQALTLLNDAAFFECAEALAERMQQPTEGKDGLNLDPTSDEGTSSAHLFAAFQKGFQWCTGRQADPIELEALHKLYQEEFQQADASAAWLGVARVLLNLDETITRE